MVNDLDVDFSADPKAAAAYLNDQRNIRKVKEHTKKLEINIIHPLREGKRLLVLDIDYSKPTAFIQEILSVPLTATCVSHPRYKALNLWRFAPT